MPHRHATWTTGKQPQPTNVSTAEVWMPVETITRTRCRDTIGGTQQTYTAHGHSTWTQQMDTTYSTNGSAFTVGVPTVPLIVSKAVPAGVGGGGACSPVETSAVGSISAVNR